jgi:N-acetylneuraminic acid mutarotase
MFSATVLAFLLAGCSSSSDKGPVAPPVLSWEWEEAVAYAGTPVSFAAAFTIGDLAYVGTGYGPTTEFWAFDPVAGSWTRKADYAGRARGAAVSFSIGGKGYIGTGYTSLGRRSDFWEYEPSSDQWTRKALLPMTGRDHAAAFVVGEKAYVVGGTSGEGAQTIYYKDVWEYDPEFDRWTRKADMPLAVAAATCFVANGVGYVGTGVLAQSPELVFSKKLFAYVPQTDTWTEKAEFPGAARFRAVGFTLAERSYLGTGLVSADEGSSEVFKDMWTYDPGADTWTQIPDFGGSARGAAVCFVLGSWVYVGTGGDAHLQRLADFWRVQPIRP